MAGKSPSPRGPARPRPRDAAVKPRDAAVKPPAQAPELPAQAVEPLCRALNTSDPATSFYDLGRRLGAPSSLAALGLAQNDLDHAAEVAMRSPYFNPRPLSYGAVRRLLQMAFDGAPPDLHSFDGV